MEIFKEAREELLQDLAEHRNILKDCNEALTETQEKLSRKRELHKKAYDALETLHNEIEQLKGFERGHLIDKKDTTFNIDCIKQNIKQLEKEEVLAQEIASYPKWEQIILNALSKYYDDVDQFIEGVEKFGEGDYVKRKGMPEYYLKWIENKKLYQGITKNYAERNLEDNTFINKKLEARDYQHLAEPIIIHKEFIKDIQENKQV